MERQHTLRDRPLRSREIRRANEKMILEIMHRKNPIAQSEVALRTGLQASTVFRIFRSLEEKNLIHEIETRREEPDRKGRKPAYYTVNSSVAYAAGIDISSYGATLMLVDFTGSTVMEETVTYENKEIGTGEMIDSIVRLIDHGLDSAKISRELLLGIGIGAPGIVDIERGTIVRYSRFPGMESCPLRDEVEARFGVPVFVHNNTSVIALSEYRYGRARGKNSLVAFLIRAGVGGAFIQHGQIFESQGKTAFEAGHLAVDMNIPLEAGEGTATVEDFVSEEAILKSVAEQTDRVRDWKDLLYCLETRDEQVLQIMRRQVRVLLGATRNIALLLNPEAILIITRFRSLSQFIAEEIDTYISSTFDPEYIDTHKIIPLQYDPLIACRGAADFAFDDYFRATKGS